MFHFPSPKPLHGFHRANSETISTVDAVALVNLAGNRIADTALGTDTVTTLTTNALIRIDTVAGLVDFFTTESKTLAVGRELGEIEVFSLRLIDMVDSSVIFIDKSLLSFQSNGKQTTNATLTESIPQISDESKLQFVFWLVIIER